MLIENIVVTSGELNTGVVQIKAIQDYTITLADELSKLEYRPIEIRINNNTGATLSLGFYTADEYVAVVAGSYSPAPSLLDIADSGTLELSGMEGEITTLYVSGSTGHTSDITCVVIKDI